MPASPSVFDPLAIENLRSVCPADGGEFLRELIDIFLTDTPTRFAEIELAFAAGKAKDVSLAAEMEIKSRSGDLTGVQDALSHLRGEFARLQPALAELKASRA